MQSGPDWFDTYYGNNLDCVVTLEASAGRKILLTWMEFDVEVVPFDAAGNCADRLEVFDGAVSLGPTLNERKCGAFIAYPETVSTGNYMTVRLTTDGSGDGLNFFQFAFTSISTGKNC